MTKNKLGRNNPNFRHGLGSNRKGLHPLHRTWSDMRRRCRDKTRRDSKWYSKKGITVCEEWQEFSVFYDWAMASGWRRGLTIDRVDSSGAYEPNNCCWATMEENRKRSTNYRMLSAFGEVKSLSDWLKDSRCKITKGTFYNRLKKGLPLEVILTDERILGAKRLSELSR